MAKSPAVILYDASGNAMAVSDGQVLGSTKAVAAAGSDGTNFKFLRTASDGTVRVDPSGTTTQPVSDAGGSLTVDGTVTANVGTTGGLALDSTLSARATEATLAAIKDTAGVKKITDQLPAGANLLGSVKFRNPGDTAFLGDATNPVRTDTTGSTTQPVGDAGGSLTVDTSQLPAALVGNRLDVNTGAWLGSTAPTVGQKAMTSSVPVTIASDQSLVPAGTPGAQSSNNSTTTALGSSGVFEGTAEDVSDWASVSFSVKSDVASAANGLSIEWGPDGTNWDVKDQTSVDAGSGRAFSLTPRARYFRIVYTNGATAQGYFRLQTTLHRAGSGLISRPLGKAIDDDNYAQTVKAALFAKNDAGTFLSLKLAGSGRLQVEVGTDDTTGSRSGYAQLGATTANTLQPICSTPYTEPTSAAQRSFSSSSANDTAAGTGARKVEITYYDNSMNGPYTETVTLNGTTAVATVATNIRFVESVRVTEAGSGGANAGSITLWGNSTGGGGTIWTIANGTILAGTGDNQTMCVHHYVAPGRRCLLASQSFATSNAGLAANAVFLVKVTTPLTANSAEKVLFVSQFVGYVNRTQEYPDEIDGPARIIAYAIPTVNNSTISAAFAFSERTI